MTAADPRSAVIGSICAPRGVFKSSGKSAGGWEGGFVTGGPIASALPDTIDFLKERGTSDFVLLAVRFMDEDHRDRFELIGARRIEGGWTTQGGAGGGGGNPARDRPWINLAGWTNEGGLCAGGQISGTGSERVAAVRLTFADGNAIDDDTDRGVSLFVVEGPVAYPATAELIDAGGIVVASHPVLKPFA